MMGKKRIIYSVVIPVFNSVLNILELFQRVKSVFEKKIGETYEVIFVDDGSDRKETWETLKEIHKNNSNVIVIQLSRNFGHHHATLCGIESARGDYIITMDDDLQHLPEELPKLIALRNHDIVLAKFIKKQHSLFKRVTSRIKGWFDYIIINKPKGISISPYRVLKKHVAKGMLEIKTPFPFIPALMLYISKDVVNVEVNHGKRLEGKTTYSFYKMVKIFSNLLINNSAFLLKIIGCLGIGIAVASLAMGCYLIYRRMVLKLGIVGWTSVIVTLLFIGGILLFSVGIIGEYLIRIISTTERKPTYFIKEKLS